MTLNDTPGDLTIDDLMRRIGRLQQDNNRLRGILADHGIPDDRGRLVPSPRPSSAQESHHGSHRTPA
ncbi:MAG: hypothetical protein AAFV53_35430 [Myxococcota bacterium]